MGLLVAHEAPTVWYRGLSLGRWVATTARVALSILALRCNNAVGQENPKSLSSLSLHPYPKGCSHRVSNFHIQFAMNIGLGSSRSGSYSSLSSCGA